MMKYGIAKAMKKMTYTFSKFCEITIYPQQKWEFYTDDIWTMVILKNHNVRIVLRKEEFDEDWKKLKTEESK